MALKTIEKTSKNKDASKAKPYEPEPKKESKPTTESDNSELDDAEMALLLQHSSPDVEDKKPTKQRSKKP